MKRSLSIFLGSCLCWGIFLFPGQSSAQDQRSEDLPLDSVALNFVEQGTYFLEIGNLDLAQDAFQAAYNRPLHQLTSAALYYWGLSAFKQDNAAEAELIFKQFRERFPLSRYQDDCSYHLSRIMLDSWRDTAAFEAFRELLFLKDSARNASLRRDATEVLEKYMFLEADEDRLEYIIQRLPLNRQLFMLDALAYKYYQKEDLTEVGRMYDFFQEKYNYFSPFIEKMFSEEKVVRYIDPGMMKVAVVIPARLEEAWLDSSQIPLSKSLPLDYYEGFRMGLENYLRIDSSKVYIEVFDSRRDSLTTENILSRLEILQPDIVIGDIYNKQSRILGDWVEGRRILQFVPISPSSSLAQGKKQVFVAHPSAREHGQSMALYAFEELKLGKVAVFRDGNNSTEQLAFAFSENFELLGGEVVDVKVPATYDKDAAKEIVKDIKKLGKENINGAYIPIQGNQESAGLILSQMKALDYKLKVMGGPHWWTRYNTVDRGLKNSYELICSTSYFVDEENAEYQNFYNSYLSKFRFPPSEYCVQGYDIALYLMEMVERYRLEDQEDLASFVRGLPPFDGLHLNIHFRGQQVNQLVNLLQFTETGPECLNCDEKMAIDPLFPQSLIINPQD